MRVTWTQSGTIDAKAATTRGGGFAAVVVSLVMVASTVHAENIIFPRFRNSTGDLSGIVDVTLPPYNADNSGATDVTAILQQVLDDHTFWQTIYLPNGTYLVSNTVTWKVCEGNFTNCNPGPIMQGQSRAGTVIKLKDNTFTSASSPRDVVKTGGGVAQDFNRGLHNLTVNTGRNNPGANGVFFYGNNQSLMSDVDIISEDGVGNIGLNLGTGEQGPCGVRDVYVKGFAIGCKSDPLNSVTVWNLTIENARQYGVLNGPRTLWIENMTCINAAVGVRNTGDLTIVDSDITGNSAGSAAIENTGQLFARNIHTSGYQRALTTSNGASAPADADIDEYATNQTSLFSSPARSMDLPVRNPPEIPWEQDTTKWGNLLMYKGGGLGSVQRSDQAAFQAAIDDPGNTTVCIPYGRAFTIDTTIYVRGNISRIVGTGGVLRGSGRIVVTDEGSVPALKIERIRGIPVVHQSSRAVVIESYQGRIKGAGAGDLFIVDISNRDDTINTSTGRVWAWQYNIEGYSEDGHRYPFCIVQNVKLMRIFGWKWETSGIAGNVQNGAVEIVGYMAYPGCQSKNGDPMFIIDNNAEFSLAGGIQLSWCWEYAYSNLIRQTRDGVTKTLTSSQNPSGTNLPLYTGYDPAIVPYDISTARSPDPGPSPCNRIGVLANGRALHIEGAPLRGPSPTGIRVYALDGTPIPAWRVRRTSSGSWVVDGLARGAYTVAAGQTRRVTGVAVVH